MCCVRGALRPGPPESARGGACAEAGRASGCGAHGLKGVWRAPSCWGGRAAGARPRPSGAAPVRAARGQRAGTAQRRPSGPSLPPRVVPAHRNRAYRGGRDGRPECVPHQAAVVFRARHADLLPLQTPETSGEQRLPRGERAHRGLHCRTWSRRIRPRRHKPWSFRPPPASGPGGGVPPGRTDPRHVPSGPRTSPAIAQHLRCDLRPLLDPSLSSQTTMISGGRTFAQTGRSRLPSPGRQAPQPRMESPELWL